MRLGFGELELAFGDRNWTMAQWAYRASDAREVQSILYSDIVALRNTVAHFHGSMTVGAIENSLRPVQQLACLLYDTEGAALVRELRDEVVAAAETMLRDMAALEGLVALPFASVVMGYNCEATLEGALGQRDRGKDYCYPEAVHRVAQLWRTSSLQSREDTKQEKEQQSHVSRRAMVARQAVRRQSMSLAVKPKAGSKKRRSTISG